MRSLEEIFWNSKKIDYYNLEEQLLLLLERLKEKDDFYKYFLRMMSRSGYSLGSGTKDDDFDEIFKNKKAYRSVYQTHLKRINSLIEQTKSELREAKNKPGHIITHSTLGNSLTIIDLLILFSLSDMKENPLIDILNSINPKAGDDL